jgi:hypothetical protein
MEGKTSQETPRKGRRRLLVIVIGVSLVVAGVAIWWQFLRPRTIVEVLAFDHLQPGSQSVVAGTVTGIFWHNTTNGPRVILSLDNEPWCHGQGNVFGDPSATYHVGDAFQTTLHFEIYSINGEPAVWAPELACPFPSNFDGIAAVSDAVSSLQSILLAYNGTEASGWSHFEIVTHNGESYRADKLPASLLRSLPVRGIDPQLPVGSVVDSAFRWRVLEVIEYLRMIPAGEGFSVVDRMASLNGPAVNGSLRFVDLNANGLVDDGDRLDAKVAPPDGTNAWNVYQLVIGQWNGPDKRYVDSKHFFLHGRSGPWDIPMKERVVPLVDLGYSQSGTGGTLTSRLNVTSVRFGRAPPLSAVRVTLSSGLITSYGGVSQLPTTLANGATLAFVDANADGILDRGDGFTLGPVGNLTSWDLQLQAGNQSIASVSWIVGLGPPVGLTPDVSFTISGINPWQATANVSFWSPPLALNGTGRISLTENGATVLANLTLGGGLLGTFAGGSLTFSDTDHDGFLSTGDSFVLQGNSNYRYVLSLSFRFESPRRVFIP